MRIRHSKNPLPRKLPSHEGLLDSADLAVNKGRLRFKVGVFKTRDSLRRFWDEKLGRKLHGSYVCAAVNSLSTEVRRFSNDKAEAVIQVDPKYFAFAGFAQRHLCMEVVAHEAVHIGFCYALRRAGRFEWSFSNDFEEELVAYPAGRAARALNCWLQDRGLWK